MMSDGAKRRDEQRQVFDLPLRLSGEKERDDQKRSADKQHQILPRGENPSRGRLKTLRRHAGRDGSSHLCVVTGQATRRSVARPYTGNYRLEGELRAKLE